MALTQDALVVDGQPVPYLFGADVQYFRARGGPGPNVPIAVVNRLWEKMAERLVQAHINVVQIYVPWDFHEPVEGVFDFEGTYDGDHDGNPDYPSRNLKGFLKLLVSHGIHRILIRPGPYINAEWGPTGFGAIPKWFIENYPQALTQSVASTQPFSVSATTPNTATFAHPVFREHVRAWFTALYDQVLKDYIGPGKPVLFLQLDNETNYFWDSLYKRDYSPVALTRYREFLANKYLDIDALNLAYGSHAADFDDVLPPTQQTDVTYPQPAWHYDWFAFHDDEIRDYFHFLRDTWEDLGVREPDVLFTSCESFNVLSIGLLPRLDYRGDGRLSFTTLNLYPKTSGGPGSSTENLPMKAAHDSALIAASHAQFYGKGGEWVLTSETQGGWFPPVSVTPESKEHTWGSVMGSGVKGMIIYYFHEGWNWDGNEKADVPMHFDAPLDANFDPQNDVDENGVSRPGFSMLEDLGQTLEGELGKALLDAHKQPSAVLLAHDTSTQYPTPQSTEAMDIASTQSAALFGLFREAGAEPDIGFLDRMKSADVARYRFIVWDDPGYRSQATHDALALFLGNGGTVLWIGGDPGDLAAMGRLIYTPSNPADGWNGDNYAELPKAATTLARTAKWLREAGIESRDRVRVKATDGSPYLHVWTRTTSTGEILLFVENFLRFPRTATVRLPTSLVAGLSGRFHVKRLYGYDPLQAEVAPQPIRSVTLPVSQDGVDIWELTAP